MHSVGGACGFVWLVTGALGRLGVVATYGAGTLLVVKRRQSVAPDGIELGGNYEPATLPPSSSSSIDRAPAQARTLSTSARASAQYLANVWSDAKLPASNPFEGHAKLDTLGQTLYPLFCVSLHEHAWTVAGYGVWGMMETYLERFGRVWIGQRWGTRTRFVSIFRVQFRVLPYEK